MYPIINVDNWVQKEWVAGSKEKTPWLQNPENEKEIAMFKETIGEFTGETWSEKVASEIGPIINIETHNADIGYHNGNYGSLVWKMVDEEVERLEEGGDIITGFVEYEDFDRASLICKKGYYCFDMLYHVMSHFGFLEQLFDMIIYDALIGNTDRHQDNFGFILSHKDKKRRFAPLYDNASSLGRELSEEGMISRLNNSQQFEAYINRADTFIRWGWQTRRKTKHFDLIKELLLAYPYFVTKSINKVNLLLDSQLECIIAQVPEKIMTEIQKNFVFKVIKTRKNRLLNMIGG